MVEPEGQGEQAGIFGCNRARFRLANRDHDAALRVRLNQRPVDRMVIKCIARQEVILGINGQRPPARRGHFANDFIGAPFGEIVPGAIPRGVEIDRLIAVERQKTASCDQTADQ